MGVHPKEMGPVEAEGKCIMLSKTRVRPKNGNNLLFLQVYRRYSSAGCTESISM